MYTTTNFIEHPEEMEESIVGGYAEVVDRENVIAGADCGFGAIATLKPHGNPQIAWAKLRSMAEGARLAASVALSDQSQSADRVRANEDNLRTIRS